MITDERYYLVKQQISERIAEASSSRLAHQGRPTRAPTSASRSTLRALWVAPRGRLGNLQRPAGTPGPVTRSL